MALERDLHDGAQQRLVAAALVLGRLRDEHESDTQLDAGLEQAEGLLRDGIDELRALVRGTRPSPLLLEGVAGAVRELVADAPLPVSVTGDAPRSAPEREAAAYFAVCEALANAGRHAAATRCDVSLQIIGSRLRLQVSDDGRGGIAERPGGGIEGLRHRMEALGGGLACEDGIDGGSRLSAELPWPPTGGEVARLRAV
jgi:signal transduction histidine kinase